MVWRFEGRKMHGKNFQINIRQLQINLKLFEEKCKIRYDKGQYWWELRSCDYYDEFEKPKIMLPDISLKCQALPDFDSGFYAANTAYIIPGLTKSDLGILNSKLVLFFYASITQTIRGGYYRFIRQYLEQIPFIKTDILDEIVTQILPTQTAKSDSRHLGAGSRNRRNGLPFVWINGRGD
jgi:hypothetical protein